MNRHVPTQTMSSREFNQNTGRAKQAADQGPVTITDRGRPAYVFMRYEDFERLAPGRETKPFHSLYDALYDPNATGDIDLMDLIPPRAEERLRDPFEAD
ncbi:type II toxin-antitoxin system prevent-host-death family antitoxin [Devosia sp. 63-57]|uniref:type II toxin-antitoxin system prevent-host-death family antitoxin n=1 Tax=Devosia sp. 63-57 TaxID=1895751 RepID=UPI00086F4ED3|nr:type II toxin-antitoxin system prevent-host-death family antitoxin [Devosia sp. 63-57]ODT47397.1 MAG: hypothetical protein ABS74_14040 [Pelagibacterium sp. SCN 63-126]ODU87074.1 MAG: hypothetical protein ABT14_06455 [Pelagibacterium sp. SCN 63-17]OJX42895.1 MAG: hypothetical protein BGO80_15830 [Devosia sp. 63-57]